MMWMKPKQNRLIDVSPSPFNNGIGICEILQSFNPPWSQYITGNVLDMYYYGSHSGNKITSPLVDKLLQGNDILTNDDLTNLASIVHKLFAKSWDRLWAVYNAEYNPIENYSMVETGTDADTVNYGKIDTRNDNLQHGKTGTETDTPNLTETRTPNTTTEIQQNIYAFNSDGSAPANTTTENNRGNEQLQRTGNNIKEYDIDETETGTVTNTQSGSDRTNREHTLRRSGNIGVTTSQQMIQSEIDLWQWDFYHNVLFPDLDRVLTIQIY